MANVDFKQINVIRDEFKLLLVTTEEKGNMSRKTKNE